VVQSALEVVRLRFAVVFSPAPPQTAKNHVAEGEDVQQHVVDKHMPHLDQSHYADAHEKGQDTSEGYWKE